MGEIEREALIARSKTIGPGWHGRVPLAGKDDPMPEPPRKTPAERLAIAHSEFRNRVYFKAIALAREVEEEADGNEAKADALRLRAMAHAKIGEWLEAGLAAESALKLEPDGDSVEVTSAELPDLIVLWRSIYFTSRRRPSGSLLGPG
jgi:hypothetical protein